jgi:hypothetical protein
LRILPTVACRRSKPLMNVWLWPIGEVATPLIDVRLVGRSETLNQSKGDQSLSSFFRQAGWDFFQLQPYREPYKVCSLLLACSR